MSELPVREMVLYKHGVGFFVREGAVSGERVALTFRQDEINDVLKSLAVFDKAGGQVLGIHYQTPMDKAARLANTSIKLSDSASLHNLLRDLRGRQATLSFESTPGTVESVTGRVIGLDVPPQPPKTNVDTGKTQHSLVSVLSGEGQVQVFKLDSLRALRIHDTQSDHDLIYFLDTSMSEDARRVVNLRLSEGEHELVVYYVAPSPTWRVSYRLVAETDESKSTGKALLQGWGLFDNRLEEDLDDVRVTLVAGQPISFIYELYASRIPQRPTVQDESRIAPGPIEFDAAAMALDEVDAAEDMVAGILPSPKQRRMLAKAAAAPAGGFGEALPREEIQRLQRAELEHATRTAVEGKETGETFQYVVTTPVSVKRGESALVPIIGSELSYQRELLYNGFKLLNHPVAALRFTNTTGLTLERGPVTVVEDGDYRGEAVVAFTKDGNEIYLPYAVELGVRVKEETKHYENTVELSIKDGFVIHQTNHIYEVSYTIENTTPESLTIIIEAPITSYYEPFDTRAPYVETASERRWSVNIPQRSKTSFVRKERRRMSHQQSLSHISYLDLQRFLENRWLDNTTLDLLREMLDNRQTATNAEKEKTTLANEVKTLYDQQEQIRKNLGALQATGHEAPLRNRVLGQLENTQNRLDEIEQHVADLNRQIAEANGRVTQIIAGLGEKT